MIYEYRVEIEIRGITLSTWVALDLPVTVGNLELGARHNAIIEAEQWIESALGCVALFITPTRVSVFLSLGGEEIELEAPIPYALTDKGARVYLLLDDNTEIELEGSI
jgi:hypothetical protein